MLSDACSCCTLDRFAIDLCAVTSLFLDYIMWIRADLLSEEGRDLGGSILISGSHSPGGRTMTSSRNSSIPASRSSLSFAL